MPWKVTIQMDADKVGDLKAEARDAAATFDYGDGSPPFEFRQRADSKGRVEFAQLAKAAKQAFDQKRSQELKAAAVILAELEK